MTNIWCTHLSIKQHFLIKEIIKELKKVKHTCQLVKNKCLSFTLCFCLEWLNWPSNGMKMGCLNGNNIFFNNYLAKLAIHLRKTFTVSILRASLVFYFQQKNERTYINFLSSDEKLLTFGHMLPQSSKNLQFQKK